MSLHKHSRVRGLQEGWTKKAVSTGYFLHFQRETLFGSKVQNFSARTWPNVMSCLLISYITCMTCAYKVYNLFQSWNNHLSFSIWYVTCCIILQSFTPPSSSVFPKIKCSAASFHSHFPCLYVFSWWWNLQHHLS